MASTVSPALDCDLAVQIVPETLPSSLAATALEDFFQTCFQRWLTELRPGLPLAWQRSAYEAALRLTDDAEIQQLNAQFRHRDQPTDVLSFAALEVEQPRLPGSDLPLELGDIIISVPTAQQQADTATPRHSLKTELTWLAAHGLLHLLGWDHPDEDSLLRMLHQQSRLLGTVDMTPPSWNL